METFRIHTPFDKQDFIRAMQIKWEIQWLKNRKELITYSIISVIILSIGIIARIKEGTINPFLLIGIGSSFVTLFFVYIRIFSKRRYSSKVKQIAEKFDSLKMDCSYEFSDESVKYWDNEKTVEFKWTVFAYYLTYKNYLILIINNSLVESYVFEKKELDFFDYNKIFEIAKSKLEYKEIK